MKIKPEKKNSIYTKNTSIFHDNRGSLGIIEKDDLPFSVRRFYFIYNNRKKLVRGEHAHRKLEQLMVCFHGSVTVHLHDGTEKHSYKLSNPETLLYVPPMTWRKIDDFSSDVVLGVFASRVYEPEDYIHTFDEFITESMAVEIAQ